MRVVSPRKNLRDGQAEVLKAALAKTDGVLSVQLPTGYGKTIAAAAVFAAKYGRGEVNRLLYVVPTTSQLNQFCTDGAGDFLDVGIAGARIQDVGTFPTQSVKEHRSNRTIVFAVTIQALATSPATASAVRELMTSGRWMVVIDEYHHYGEEKAWARAALSLPAVFVLAMSATPRRRENDGAIADPTVCVSYLSAFREKAVKELHLHAYDYKVDAITVNGEMLSFTTGTLAEAAGPGDGAVDRFMAERKLRWSPKYISPLVSIPVERLLRMRGGLPLQMIVGAMGCMHAEMVCDQIRSMFGDCLRVDWVGTGPHGRTDDENRRVIGQFCPPKKNGVRRPQDIDLDILVHVGMAGEGLDSVYVTEVVHLNPATVSNQNDQENGRAARRIPGAPEQVQIAHINVDSSSPYAEWSGSKVMQVFDRVNGDGPVDDDGADGVDAADREDRERLPDEPLIVIADCELRHIDKGDPEVQSILNTWAAKVQNGFASLTPHDLEQMQQFAIATRRRELVEGASGMDLKSKMMQLRDSVNSAVGAVASLATRRIHGTKIEKSQIGETKRRIFCEIKKRFGQGIAQADEEELRARYEWVKNLERTLINEAVPGWLTK